MNQPRGPWHLAWVCNRLALQGFGGVLAVAQHEFVERERWLSSDEFLELLTTAQLMPGPNVINLSILLGDRYFGARGVLAVLLGMLGLPLLLVISLASLAQSYVHLPAVQGALRGMGLVAAGLLLGACWKLAEPLRRSALGVPRAFALAAIAALMVGVLRWPLLPVLIGVGGLGMLLAHRAAKP